MSTKEADKRPGISHSNSLNTHPKVKILSERKEGESLFSTMVRLSNEECFNPIHLISRRQISLEYLESLLMTPKKLYLPLEAKKSVEFTEITRFVDGALKNQDPRDRIEDGIAVVSVESPGNKKRTSAITFMEYEDGTAQDLNNALERLVDTNNDGHSKGVEHIKAELFKPFLALPFQEVTMTPGTWGRLVHMGCDKETCSTDTIKIEIIPAKINMFEIRDKKTEGRQGLWAVDITERVENIIKASKEKEGDILLFTPHTTGGIVPINGSGIKQFKSTLREFAPADIKYWHDHTVGDGNGISHLQAVFLGPQFSVHYKNGVPEFNEHRVFYVDCDVAPARPRKVVVAEYQAPKYVTKSFQESPT